MRGNSQTKDNLEITRQQQKETARNYNVNTTRNQEMTHDLESISKSKSSPSLRVGHILITMFS